MMLIVLAPMAIWLYLDFTIKDGPVRCAADDDVCRTEQMNDRLYMSYGI